MCTNPAHIYLLKVRTGVSPIFALRKFYIDTILKRRSVTGKV